MKEVKASYWVCFIIFSFIFLSLVGYLSIDPKMYGKREPFKLNTSSEHLYWSYMTNEKVRSVAISDNGEYLVASTDSPDGSTYLFNNEYSILKAPLWIFRTAGISDFVSYRSTETLYYNEYWYEYEHIPAGSQINFNVQSSPSLISFAIWDQPFHNLPLTTKYGSQADIFQLISYSYDYFSIFLKPNSTINYKFNATGVVDFFICDGNNFYLWLQGLPSSFYVDIQDTISGNGSFLVPSTQDYYLVWYNEGTSSISVDYIIDYIALNVINLNVTDFYIEATHSIPQQTFIVPSEGDWYFFIYFDPMNSPEESTTISFDVTYGKGISVNAVDISANGDYIAAVNDDNYVFLLNNSITNPKKPIWEFLGNNSFNDVAISKDGNLIIAATGTGEIYLLNNSATNPKQTLWNYTIGDVVYSLAISANGDYITVAGWDGKLYFFSRYSPIPLWTYLAGSKIFSVDISSDGNYIVAGTYDAQVLLFYKGSPIPLWSYFTGGEVYTVAMNADGKYIIAGGSDNTFYLFEQSSSIPLWNYTAGGSFGRSDFPRCIAISHDGKFIAVGTQDSTFYYFGKASSIPLWSHILGGEVNAIAMSSDGSYVAVASNDFHVYLFHHEIDANHSNFPFELMIIVSMISGGAVISAAIILLIRRKIKSI